MKRKVIIFVISNAGTTGPGSDFEFLEVALSRLAERPGFGFERTTFDHSSVNLSSFGGCDTAFDLPGNRMARPVSTGVPAKFHRSTG